MKITNISYEKCHNLGNYEHEKIRMDAVIDEGEDVQEAMNELISQVDEGIETSTRQRITAYEMQWGRFAHMGISQKWRSPDGDEWLVTAKSESTVTVQREGESEDVRELTPIDVKNWCSMTDADYDPMADEDEDEDAFAEE